MRHTKTAVLDRRRTPVVCACGAKMLASSTQERFTWYKCQNPHCGETCKVMRHPTVPGGG